MSSIRLTYSGIIALAVRLSSLITGMIFTIFVTRNLVVVDFGLYALIGSLVAYSMFGHVISGYWITRHISRGDEVGRTGLFMNGIFSIAGTIAYFIAAYFVAQNTNSDFTILALGAILIPATYIANTLDNINQGFRPQNVSYSFIVFEITKIPFGFVLLEGIEIGLAGAIVATFLALLAKIIISIFFAWPCIRGIIHFSYMRRWLKLSWLSLYDNISSNIYVLDTLIISIFLNTTEPIAYYAAATTIATIAAHSAWLSTALTPKLISDAKPEYVITVMRLFTLFGIPFFVLVLVFAKPLLFLLNPAYSIAILVVYILTVRSFTYAIYTIFAGILAGIERVDTNEKASFSQYRKSNLFLLGTLHHIRAGLYIGSLVILSSVSKIFSITTLDLLVLWALMAFIAEISITTYSAFLVYKAKFLYFDLKSTAKYIITAVIAASMSFYFLEHFIVFERDIVIFLPRLIISVLVGTLIYLVSMFFFDDYMRSLIHAILRRTR